MEDNSAVPSEIYEILATADWETLGKKMLARAIWRGSQRYRITNTTIFARGCSIEDVISYIIQSAFEGNRKWDPQEKDLEDWLLSQVDSVMDWWLKLRENRNLVYEEFESAGRKEDHENKFVQSSELEIVLRYGPPSPETLIIKDMDEEEAKELYNALFDDAADDPELQEILLVMIDMDNPTPRDIAEKLGIPVEDVYNRKKRLKRRLDKVMTALRKSIP